MRKLPATRRVVVSLHDVAPPYEAVIRAQLDLLAAIGVSRVVLKVVPNWHGGAPMNDAPALVDLLRAQVAGESQLVLHGYEHRPHGPFRGPLMRRARARLFAASAAEFLTLSPAEAELALRKGLACFAEAGLPTPAMFCAPGWLHNAAALSALKRTGFSTLIGMFTCQDLRSGRRIWTPGVGYMGASSGQETGVQILNGMVRGSVLRRATLAKVYLHPQHDPQGPIVRGLVRQLARMIRDEGWQPATYTEVLADE